MQIALATMTDLMAWEVDDRPLWVDFLRDDAGRLCLSELELVEPSLFLRHAPAAATALAEALLARLTDGRQAGSRNPSRAARARS